MGTGGKRAGMIVMKIGTRCLIDEIPKQQGIWHNGNHTRLCQVLLGARGETVHGTLVIHKPRATFAVAVTHCGYGQLSLKIGDV